MNVLKHSILLACLAGSVSMQGSAADIAKAAAERKARMAAANPAGSSTADSSSTSETSQPKVKEETVSAIPSLILFARKHAENINTMTFDRLQELENRALIAKQALKILDSSAVKNAEKFNDCKITVQTTVSAKYGSWAASNKAGNALYMEVKLVKESQEPKAAPTAATPKPTPTPGDGAASGPKLAKPVIPLTSEQEKEIQGYVDNPTTLTQSIFDDKIKIEPNFSYFIEKVKAAGKTADNFTVGRIRIGNALNPPKAINTNPNPSTPNPTSTSASTAPDSADQLTIKGLKKAANTPEFTSLATKEEKIKFLEKNLTEWGITPDQFALYNSTITALCTSQKELEEKAAKAFNESKEEATKIFHDTPNGWMQKKSATQAFLQERGCSQDAIDAFLAPLITKEKAKAPAHPFGGGGLPTPKPADGLPSAGAGLIRMKVNQLKKIDLNNAAAVNTFFEDNNITDPALQAQYIAAAKA